jgi:hypothetical protein
VIDINTINLGVHDLGDNLSMILRSIFFPSLNEIAIKESIGPGCSKGPDRCSTGKPTGLAEVATPMTHPLMTRPRPIHGWPIIRNRSAVGKIDRSMTVTDRRTMKTQRLVPGAVIAIPGSARETDRQVNVHVLSTKCRRKR